MVMFEQHKIGTDIRLAPDLRHLKITSHPRYKSRNV